ncbi:hypothetical protein TNCV_1089181 [Trichonephila clavipes]|uniref:Uncharacterized protein n=1 Tax=Trichonephila clavipes TaxID=2585209 RepID=A0A8X6SX85_TRICX|nr:hypothetical protein TNCV_1089181 [Trichonephila clavipes]
MLSLNVNLDFPPSYPFVRGRLENKASIKAYRRGRDSLVIMVSNSWLMCHELEARRVESLKYVKSVEAQCPLVDDM